MSNENVIEEIEEEIKKAREILKNLKLK